jgi:hypothetical protein
MIEFLADSRRQGILMAVATAAGKANRAFTLDGLGIAADYTSLRPQDLLRMVPPPKPA